MGCSLQEKRTEWLRCNRGAGEGRLDLAPVPTLVPVLVPVMGLCRGKALMLKHLGLVPVVGLAQIESVFTTQQLPPHYQKRTAS